MPRLCVPADPVASFLGELQSSVTNGSFVKLTLSGNAGAKSADASDTLSRLTRVEGRLVEIKKGVRLQLTHKYEHRDTCVNVELRDVASRLEALLSPDSRNAQLFSGARI